MQKQFRVFAKDKTQVAR